jgi:hypothetical protein
MQDEAGKRLVEEKRRAEKRQRHLQDDLRYALKKLPEAIDVNLDYEAVRSRPPSCYDASIYSYVHKGGPFDREPSRVQSPRR